MGRALRPAQLPEVVDRTGRGTLRGDEQRHDELPTDLVRGGRGRDPRRDQRRRAPDEVHQPADADPQPGLPPPAVGLAHPIGLPPLARRGVRPGPAAVRLPDQGRVRRLGLEERDGRARRADRPLLDRRPHGPAHVPAERVLLEQLDLRGPRRVRHQRRDRAGARDIVDEHDQLDDRRRDHPLHAAHRRHVPRRRGVQLRGRQAQLRPRLRHRAHRL